MKQYKKLCFLYSYFSFYKCKTFIKTDETNFCLCKYKEYNKIKLNYIYIYWKSNF